MSTDTRAIATFNSQLIRAKLAALQILQDLMNSLCDPDPPIPARFRELRLLAGAILRTQPLKPPTDGNPEDRAPQDRAPPQSAHQPLAPKTPPPSPAEPDSSLAPPPRHFNPHSDWARDSIRTLVKQGYLPPSFLRFLTMTPTAVAKVLASTRAPPRAELSN